MLAEREHKDIANFLMEYKKEGAKILSQYQSTNSVTEEEEEPYAVINDTEHTRKVSLLV